MAMFFTKPVSILYKFALMMLVFLQQTVRVSIHVYSAWNVRQIYLMALGLMLACVIPSLVYSVRDRARTLHFVLESFGMMLCTALFTDHLLRSEHAIEAVVVMQVLLSHIFYNFARAAHEHQHKKLLSYRHSVRVVGMTASCIFPLVLSIRCPMKEVHMSIALMVMFTGEVTGFMVMLVCAVLRSICDAYENIWHW